VAGSCEYGDEPSGSVATELVSFMIYTYNTSQYTYVRVI
jgi:hypothetical protein